MLYFSLSKILLSYFIHIKFRIRTMRGNEWEKEESSWFLFFCIDYACNHNILWTLHFVISFHYTYCPYKVYLSSLVSLIKLPFNVTSFIKWPLHIVQNNYLDNNSDHIYNLSGMINASIISTAHLPLSFHLFLKCNNKRLTSFLYLCDS